MNIKLEGKDILLVNATIITGIFILLTVSNFEGSHQLQSTQYRLTIAQWIGITIIPFAASSLVIVIGSYRAVYNKINETTVGRKTSLLVLGFDSAGFVYLIVLVFILSHLE
jgi:hypothetical protein